MSLVKQAIWIIERHLDRDLTLTHLAASCRVTPTHLSHAFSERLGKSLTAYIRGRRLTHAARQLAGGAPDILQVALAAGYGSHEALTRAFGSEFHTTPQSVREAGTVLGLDLTDAADMIDDLESVVALTRRQHDHALRLIGIGERVASGTTHVIPGLWQAFGTLYPFVKGRSEPAPVGLTGPFDPDGTFDYACAVAVTDAAPIPSGMKLFKIPAAEYAVFRHEGHVSTIGRTYQILLDRSLPERNWTVCPQPIIERHDEGFDVQTGMGGVSICVPIQ